MTTAEERLRIFIEDIAKKEHYATDKIDIKPIDSGGANYTTDVYMATISDPLKPDINIFAKTANLNQDTRDANVHLAGVYDTEATFYSKLAVNFERIYNKHKVPTEDRMAIPKCYGHVLIPLQEILVLENLEAAGFQNFDRTKILNWKNAAAAVTQMARFHAIGLAFREENPVEFERIVKIFDFDHTKNELMINSFLATSLDNGCRSLPDNEKQRLINFYATLKEQGTIVRRVTEDKTMLIHSDIKPTNLMHRCRNNELEVIVLDYQTLKLGNPMLDLMYFIFSASDEEFRRLHFQPLLDHYFAQLTLALRQVNVDVEKVYPRKTFEADFIEMRPLGLCFGMMLAGIATLAPEDAPKLEGDLTKMQMPINEQAKERIRGIVSDFIRWGVL